MNSFIVDDPFYNENDIKKKCKTSRIPETLYYRDTFCHNLTDSCELFNEHFADQFYKPSSYNIHINFKNDSNYLYLYNISEVKVYNLLHSINPNKATGPDNIHAQILKTVHLVWQILSSGIFISHIEVVIVLPARNLQRLFLF